MPLTGPVCSDQFKKDGFEDAGNFCLFLTQHAFGHQRLTVSAEGIPVVQKVEASVGWIFLWLLTLPLNLIGFAVGAVCYALSSTHQHNHDLVGQAKQDQELEEWHQEFVDTRNKNLDERRQAQRRLRIPVLRETLRAAREGFYVGGRRVRLDPKLTRQMKARTVGYTSGRVGRGSNYMRIRPLKELKNRYMTSIEIRDEDTFDLMKRFQYEGLNPAGLILANSNTRGGGVKRGSGSQEGQLFRRSNLEEALGPKQKTLYPIPHDGGSVIYVPKVQVFRGPEVNLRDAEPVLSYKYRKPFTVDMIACASFMLRRRGNRLNGTQMEILREKIRNIFRVALNSGHDSLVLGALGCGSFHNPPEQVAECFARVIAEREFDGCFSKIGFAILNNENLREIFNSAFRVRGLTPRNID